MDEYGIFGIFYFYFFFCFDYFRYEYDFGFYFGYECWLLKNIMDDGR